MSTRALGKIAIITIPAAIVATLVMGLVIEIWVRARWNPRNGLPGFYVADALTGQRLAPNYDGWFAGVPVHINSFGFRDPREYTLSKPAGAFRILVLGDSVTFGHGAVYDTTYPFLFEQRLKEWRPDVAWQVWNLGVPGYNTSQELALLLDVGPRYQPDLVIVGFYGNDLTDNIPVGPPTLPKRLGSAFQGRIQRSLYSYEFYKRIYLTARWRLLTSEKDRLRLQHLDDEEHLLAAGDERVSDPRQRLSDADYLDDRAVAEMKCRGVPPPGRGGVDELRGRVTHSTPDDALWLDAVRGFQRLSRDGTYPIVFFVNSAPGACEGMDRFYDNGALAYDDELARILGDGVPVVSTVRAFLHYRPSQMPLVAAHAIGNSNRVKSDVLFEFLRDHPSLLRTLPPRPLDAPSASRR